MIFFFLVIRVTRVHPLEFFGKGTVVKSRKEKSSQDNGFNYPHQAREYPNEDVVEKHEIRKDEEEPPVTVQKIQRYFPVFFLYKLN